ncbi:hypothetical protein [Oricola thermophila]|uniref:Uncharacterized protein n=1 Tax=Oricola thermophila TaxID=2742145 RepID=A0A6N1VHR3_9HYPH|nr:hypothetical protein [Oricola thermophila]QKV20441.1 hypothetical protein HTY61_19295 [Oricola thermophila]
MKNAFNSRGRHLVRAASATLLLFAVVSPASAIERFRSDIYSCASVKETLHALGAAVIQYPSTRVDNYMLYDRYVASRAHCSPDEKVVPATVIASDTETCGVHRCVSRDQKKGYRRGRPSSSIATTHALP